MADMQSHRRPVRVAGVAGILGLSLIVTGCDSPPPSVAPPTAASTTAPSTSVTSRVVASDLRYGRYCEVLLVRLGGAGLAADVYNSYGLNECPESAWAALDARQIARDNGALTAVLNGPRYWLMDSIAKDGSPEDAMTFDGIAMRKEATVNIGDPMVAKQPYTPRTVDRQTTFTFDAGRRIYELVEPTGTRWVMQSWSQQKDPTLAEADLQGLGSRLTLPDGWRYEVSTPTSPLQVVTTDTSAQVLQDDLGNSYSKRE